jgi:hypothetical protein
VYKVKRPALKPRITKVRDQYKQDAKKRLGNYTMYHDEGIPAGVSEKKAACVMDVVGENVNTLMDFNRCSRDLEKLPMDEGTNIRLFKSEYQEPAPDTDKLEKGGKYMIRVSKALAADMFEELCTYFMDSRLDNAIVGVCRCIRNQFDLIQLWTKSALSHTTVEVFGNKLLNMLGTSAVVSYSRHSDTWSGKVSKARKYYLVEAVSGSPDGAALSTNTIVQPREFGTKKEKKQGKDEFVEIASTFKPKKETKTTGSPTLAPSDDAPGVTALNNYDMLDVDDNAKGADTGDDIKIYEKKKSDKTRKGSTKKGSKKEKGKKDEFESLLGESSAPLISQQMFVGGGLATVLVVAVIAVMMSGVLN